MPHRESSASSIWLSVVIPAYNEAERIHSTLDRVLAYLRRRERPFEVVVVDDGSQDGSAAEIGKRPDPEIRGIRLDRNRGKGAAVREGVLASAGELILITDADLSTPIEELERLEAALTDRVSWVIGSRGLPGSKILVSQPFYRTFMGKTFNFIIRTLGLHEATELPVTWRHVPESRVHPLMDSARMLRDVFQVRLADWRGDVPKRRAREMGREDPGYRGLPHED